MSHRLWFQTISDPVSLSVKSVELLGGLNEIIQEKQCSPGMWKVSSVYLLPLVSSLLRWGFPGGSAVKNLPVNARDAGSNPGRSGRVREGEEDPLEKEMATHSRILAWEIPWTEEPGRLQSMGSQRVRCDLVTKQQKHIKVFLDPGSLLSVAVPWIYASSRKLQITECEVKRT